VVVDSQTNLPVENQNERGVLAKARVLLPGPKVLITAAIATILEKKTELVAYLYFLL
jgi:hypothetical protein